MVRGGSQNARFIMYYHLPVRWFIPPLMSAHRPPKGMIDRSPTLRAGNLVERGFGNAKAAITTWCGRGDHYIRPRRSQRTAIGLLHKIHARSMMVAETAAP